MFDRRYFTPSYAISTSNEYVTAKEETLKEVSPSFRIRRRAPCTLTNLFTSIIFPFFSDELPTYYYIIGRRSFNLAL